ncbi:MAG: 30S ribosomal protein S1 [Desulfobacterales bacterium]|jgi:small subunit ribosomal protein S1|nr:30S ribosomal protein S1 [Desulfobacterales bacterium]
MDDDIQNENDEESFAALFESYNQGMSQDIQIGDKIKGQIISIGRDTVFLDTGTKIDGAADRAELLDEDGNLPYQLGDELELYVTAMTESEIILSKAISGIGGVNLLQDAHAQRIPVEGKVSATCKGGFNVEILQRRAFCPISQMDIVHIETPDDYVGQRFSFLITRFEENGRNIVVSRRQLLQQEKDALQKEIFDKLTINSEWDGQVTRILPFGAFVDIAGGIEGMVHISELSWSRVETPQEVIQVGDTVRVKIIGIKPSEEGKNRPKISLSIKQVQGDPWDQLNGKLKAGDIVEGKVTRCASFGAFVEIFPGIEGLVHISEMSYEKRVVNAEDIVRPKDRISVLVKDVDLEKRRITLSIRETKADPWTSFKDNYASGQRITGTLEKKEKFGFFIQLAPGVTGLLPQSKINQTPDRADFEKLKPGDSVSVLIEEIKPNEKKVTLAPGDGGDAQDWKNHTQKDSIGLGDLGEKLRQALQTNEKKSS